MILTGSKVNAYNIAIILIRWLMVVTLVMASITPLSRVKVVHAVSPTLIATGILTVGGLLVAANFAKSAIDDSISQVDQDVAARLSQAGDELERVINLIETKYQNSLDLTLASLDNVAAGQFGRAYNLVLAMDQALARTTSGLEAAGIRIITQAATEFRAVISYLEQRTEQLVFVAAQSGVWVVDNLWETLLSVIALVYLGGLLLIAYGQTGTLVQKEPMISRRRIGILGAIFAVLLVFGLLLLFWKPLRAAIMTRTVPALQDRLEVNASPQLFAVVPLATLTGQDAEVTLLGAHLPAEEPKATVGTLAVPVKVHQENQVVLTLSGDVTQLTGAQPVTLHYDSLKQDLSSVLTFVGPGPDLVISSLTVSPTLVLAGQPAQVNLEVRNQGDAVQHYVVQVSFGHPDIPDETIDQQEPLAQGETRTFSVTRTYDSPGSYVIVARILSTTPAEQPSPDRDNNLTMQSINVQPSSYSSFSVAHRFGDGRDTVKAHHARGSDLLLS